MSVHEFFKILNQQKEKKVTRKKNTHVCKHIKVQYVTLALWILFSGSCMEPMYFLKTTCFWKISKNLQIDRYNPDNHQVF